MAEQDAVLHNLRIAIAMAVLKVKPPHQSCLSYLLEMKQLFPLQFEKLSPDPEAMWWRTRALELGRNNAYLQRQLESKIILDSNGPTSPVPLTSSFVVSSNENEKTKKLTGNAKKRQAETQSDPPGVDFKRQRRLHERIQQLKTASPLPGSKSLLGSIQMFLTTIMDVACTGQAVETGVRRIMEQAMQQMCRSSSADLPLLLDTLDNTLPLVIRISLPCLTSTMMEHGAALQQSPLPHFLDCISDRVLVCLIRSFFDISRQRAFNLLERLNAKKVGTIDPRPRCLLLISHIWGALTSVFSRYTSTSVGSNHLLLTEIMRESMVLETLRHFRQILNETEGPDVLLGLALTHDSDGKDLGRKRALRVAVKETIWYLCSILQIFLKWRLGEQVGVQSAAVLIEKDDRKGPSEYAPTVSVSEWELREDDIGCAREEPRKRDGPKERSKCDGTTESWFRSVDLLKQLVLDNLFSLLDSGKQDLRVMTRDSAMDASWQNLSKAGIEFRGRGSADPFQLDDVERSMFMHVVECYIFGGTSGSEC